MSAVDDAWEWYQAVAAGADQLAHLAKYWDDFPWQADEPWVGRLAGDNVLRHVAAADMRQAAATAKERLDDLAVMVLFSAFEAAVRDLVYNEVRPEVERVRHPALRHAGVALLGDIETKSFSRLLDRYKAAIDNDLIEQVKQVRQYRNWVSHGRRPPKPGRKAVELVRPKDARERLKAFLAAVQPRVAPDPLGPEATR